MYEAMRYAVPLVAISFCCLMTTVFFWGIVVIVSEVASLVQSNLASKRMWKHRCYYE